MRIEEIKPSEGQKGRFLVKLSDGSLLRVTEEELLRFALVREMELGDRELEELQRMAAASNAKAAAANMIGRRALSKSELRQRLIKKGAAAADAEAAVDWLEDIGAVDDAGYAGIVARHYASLGYGAARVRQELRRRGIDRSLWEEALAQLPEPAEAVEDYLHKKCRGDLSDPKERKRMADALLRRGFGWAEIRAALARFGEMGEE